ncbi:MAG: histidine phosphatase family protein [Acidobacteria bacterium]|nr:histidine phosphatase family protein [Acidobacteriota bacterium]MCI0620395.1 histidine phosphatase family protein [Acidobacteriota bacterium]MCI0722221.1 histidine phosphatase family protein [Acidobacteriota bacterium]
MNPVVESCTEIYLIRHGQSVHNQEQTIAGQLDSELTPLGFEDARSVAAAIGPRDFEVIYSSDLLRARQTAETVINTLQLNCPLYFSPLLRELNYGRFTERSVVETFQFLNYKRVPHERYPEGESFQDLQERVGQFLSQLLEESAGRRILVTAHAGSIRLLAMLLDPAHKQEHLERAYGNRFLGKAVLDENGLVLLEVIQNPERGGF